MSRKLTAYEHNYLLKHGLDEAAMALDGEMPVEYIRGKAYFLDYEFAVTRDVLIPRLETEGIVTKALDWCRKNYRAGALPLSIADVGTGSGCIGISLFLELSKQTIPSEIYLSDISLRALKIARKNAQRLIAKHLSGLKLFSSPGEMVVIGKKFLGKIAFLQSDLLSGHPQQKYHLILANLPYIPSDRLERLPHSVKDYEPRVALDGGQNGLGVMISCITQAEEFLDAQGLMIFEVDEFYSLTDFQGVKRFNLVIGKDIFDRNRYLLLTPRGD